jgi:hypothetical protein
MDCQCGMGGNTDIIKVSANGEILNRYSQLNNWFESHQIFKYRNGFVFYYKEFSEFNNIKWKYISFFGDTINFTDLPDRSINAAFSNKLNQLLFLENISIDNSVIKQVDSTGQTLIQTDTIAGSYFTFENYLIPNASFNQRTAFGLNNRLFVMNENLSFEFKISHSYLINHLQFDENGNLFVLLGNGNLLKYDENLELVNTINLNNLAPKINFVKWFYVNEAQDILAFGGYLIKGTPFIKSVGLSNLNQNENHLGLTVTNIKIANAVGIYQTQNGESILKSYSFDLKAMVKNTGSEIIQSFFLNCKEQQGFSFFYCNKPWKSHKVESINMLPGDSLVVDLGTYFDNNLYVNLIGQNNNYNLNEFCVWPSHHNGSWSYADNEDKCTDVSLSLTVGINETQNLSSVNLFPNPTNSVVYFKSEKILHNAFLRIYDLKGVVVSSSNFFASDIISIDISEIVNGMYIAEIVSEEGIYKTKLLKQ